MFKRWQLAGTAVMSVAALVLSGSPASANRSLQPAFTPPERYSLTLGDSIAFGYQRARITADLAGGTYNPTSFPGYVQPLTQTIAARTHHQQIVVNYSCPGETTTSMVSGPCAFADKVHGLGYPVALHNDYPGAQLDAAVSFLSRHRGQISPITLSIGANDLLALINQCPGDTACVIRGLPGTLQTINAQLTTILHRVRAVAPSVEILVLTPYNPTSVLSSETDALLAQANSVISTIARDHRARTVDGFATINLAIAGDETASVCTYTLMCPTGDIHPSDAGYQRLAEAFWTASGYQRLERGHRD